MNIVDQIEQRTNTFIKARPKGQRKGIGQFFTGGETARFMAGLYDVPDDCSELSVLDPGAGAGILSGALIERLQSSAVRKLKLVCYEKNEDVLDLLSSNLEMAAANSKFPVDIEMIHDDYILSQADRYNTQLWTDDNARRFDVVISNPPYLKLSKDADEARAMRDVCYGAPNIYFLFMSMGVFNLKDNGVLIYIVPRSWTSGAYFKQFRQTFLTSCSLEHIHLFTSRDEVFDGQDVLQETMIVKARKRTDHDAAISISSSFSSSDFSHMSCFDVDYGTVVAGRDAYVYLPVTNEEIAALDRLKKLKDTLPSIGLKMKTGLTVDFRNRDALSSIPETRSVPLFYSQHIQNGKVIFPVGKEFEYIRTDRPSLLQKNANYLFVKRFTAKEERRRLQCGVYLAKDFPGYGQISTQNKINFIDSPEELQEDVVYGLYVIFNSSLYDTYYRILNGSTQVNSTEINSMPVPPIDVIRSMGAELIRVGDMSEATCNRILGDHV